MTWCLPRLIPHTVPSASLLLETLLLNVDDITNHQARPDVPFFAEENAGDRPGPLPTSLGLLQDLSQIAEAAQFDHFSA